MKKTIGLMAVASLLLSACGTVQQTTQKTATTADVSMQVHSTTVADLKVGDRITYTMTPSDDVLRGGEANVKHVAEAEALVQKGGNADVLVEPKYTITKKHRPFGGSKITSITVSGRPAFYTNFRSLPDSVLANPVFRGLRTTARYTAPRQKTTPTPVIAPVVKDKKRSMRKTGLNMQFEIDLGASSNIDGDYPTVGFSINPTYYLNSHFGVGLGLGFSYQGDDHEDFWSVPLYAHARYFFSPTAKSWFADARLGANLACYKSLSTGAHVGVGIGYSFKHFEIALRYNYSGNYEKQDYDPYYDYDDEGVDASFYSHQGLLSLAWKF